MATYDELAQNHKDLILAVRIAISDNDEDNRYLDDDTYASLLTNDVLHDINATPPATKLSLNQLTNNWEGLVYMGLRAFTYGTLIDKYVEQPDLSSLMAAHSSTRDYNERWQKSYDTWSARYDTAKKNAKKQGMMPGLKLSVGGDFPGLGAIRNYPRGTRRRLY